MGSKHRPETPNLTTGSRLTGSSRTTYLAAVAVLEPIKTINARAMYAPRSPSRSVDNSASTDSAIAMTINYFLDDSTLLSEP